MEDINDFFESYAQSLETFDSKRLAFLHNIPCSLLSDDSTTFFNDAGRLEGFFNQGMSYYRQFGIAKVSVEVLSRINISEKIVKARVLWKYYDASNQPIYQCNYQYIIKVDKHQHLKIVVSISVDEKEQMEAWLHQSERS
jgi:hypothetical protein